MFDVITIGSSTRDVLIKSDDFRILDDQSFEGGHAECLPLGSKIEINEIYFTTGGGGSNPAVTFARQGFHTACVGVVGNDLNGKEIVADLDKEGVDTSFFQRHDDYNSAYSIILVHSSGERTILSYKGEGQHFDVTKIPFDKLMAKWFYLDSLGGHYDLFEQAVNFAVAHNIKIACNPGGKELKHGLEKLKPLLKHIDIYITNKEEGEELLGVGVIPAEEVARKLKDYLPGIVIVSDGIKGATVIDSDGAIYTAGVPNSPVVERTGAGDAFGSGFVCEYIRETRDKRQETGEAIIKSIQFATANASSVVTQFGAKASILHKGDFGPWKLVEVIKK